MVAAENHVHDLVSLLTHLAECCRDDVRMRTRVWVARPLAQCGAHHRRCHRQLRCRSSLLQRDYLRAYASGAGIAVLLVIITMFATSLMMMVRLGRFESVSRFIARDTAGAA